MWVYIQETGKLYAPDGEVEGQGYSGFGEGENNPSWQAIEGYGPIPVGKYKKGPAFTHPRTGQITMELIPDPANQMFGRDDFLCHGDNQAANHTASHGCIIMGRAIRLALAHSDDDDVIVVAFDQDYQLLRAS